MSLHLTKGSNYEDRDGQIKTFTTVDWSKKTKISTQDIDMGQVRKELREYRDKVLERIFSINPFFAGEEYRLYLVVVETPEGKKFEWNKKMLMDEGVDIDNLARMVVLLESRQELGRDYNV